MAAALQSLFLVCACYAGFADASISVYRQNRRSTLRTVEGRLYFDDLAADIHQAAVDATVVPETMDCLSLSGAISYRSMQTGSAEGMGALWQSLEGVNEQVEAAKRNPLEYIGQVNGPDNGKLCASGEVSAAFLLRRATATTTFYIGVSNVVHDLIGNNVHDLSLLKWTQMFGAGMSRVRVQNVQQLPVDELTRLDQIQRKEMLSDVPVMAIQTAISQLMLVPAGLDHRIWEERETAIVEGLKLLSESSGRY